MEKSGNGPVNAGDDVVFSIDVKNGGPGTAKSVSLNDPLPSGTASPWAISSQPAGDPCSITGNTLSCAFGDLAPGASETVEVTAATTFADCTVYDNTATASSTNAPNDSTTLTPKPTSLARPRRPNQRRELLHVRPTPARDRRHETARPAPSRLTATQPVVGSTLDAFRRLAAAPDGTVRRDRLRQRAVYDNTATASSANAPNDSDDGQVSCRKPDLSITKTPDAQNINAAKTGLTIQVDNVARDREGGQGRTALGPVAAADVFGPDAADCVSPVFGSTLDCSFGDLAAGASKTVTVAAATDAENCAVYNNTATASSANAPNDSDDGQVSCLPPGLGAIKTAVSGTINAGENAVFNITVSNTGTGTATGVTLSDPLPSGVSGAWVVSGPDAGDCASPIVGNTLDCDFGDLAAGESKTVTVTAPTDFDNCTTLDNTATAKSTNAPTDADDASINCQKPNLTVDKTPDAQTINAGENVVFDVTVSNAGPGTAKAVTLSDPLPGPVSGNWAVSGADAADCVSPIAGGTLDCSFGELAAGASKTVTVTAATDYDNCAVYDNTRPLFGQCAETRTRSGDLPQARPCRPEGGHRAGGRGENIEFAIQVSNNGPGTAKDVTLVDNLPTGTAGPWTIETQPPGDPCSITGNTLNCSFGIWFRGSR